jgi:hypothetical protein
MGFIGHTESLPDQTLIGLAIIMRTVIQQVIEFLLDQVFLCFCQRTHSFYRRFCKINDFRLFFCKSAAYNYGSVCRDGTERTDQG